MYLNNIEVTNLVIPNGTTEIIRSTFYSCSSITTVTIPASVEFIGTASFARCPNLTDVYYEGTVQEWQSISKGPNWMYEPRGTLHFTDGGDFVYELNEDGISYTVSYLGEVVNGDLVIPSTYNDLPVTNINDYAFYNQTAITNVTIQTGIIQIGEGSFSGCTNLETISIPNSVLTIGAYAFTACKSLVSIAIPDSVTTMGDYAFNNCLSLSSITLSNNLTNISEQAFCGCAFDSIFIPVSVIFIGRYAFYDCSNLTLIGYGGTEEQWHAINKGEKWALNGRDISIVVNP